MASLADSAVSSSASLPSLVGAKDASTKQRKLGARRTPAESPFAAAREATADAGAKSAKRMSETERAAAELAAILKPGAEHGHVLEQTVKRYRGIKKRIARIENYEHNDPATLNVDQRDALRDLPDLRGAIKEYEQHMLRALATADKDDRIAAADRERAHAAALARARAEAKAEARKDMLATFATYVSMVRELAELDPEDEVVARIRSVVWGVPAHSAAADETSDVLRDTAAIAERAWQVAERVARQDETEVDGVEGVTYAQMHERLIAAPLRLESEVPDITIDEHDLARALGEDDTDLNATSALTFLAPASLQQASGNEVSSTVSEADSSEDAQRIAANASPAFVFPSFRAHHVEDDDEAEAVNVNGLTIGAGENKSEAIAEQPVHDAGSADDDSDNDSGNDDDESATTSGDALGDSADGDRKKRPRRRGGRKHRTKIEKPTTPGAAEFDAPTASKPTEAAAASADLGDNERRPRRARNGRGGGVVKKTGTVVEPSTTTNVRKELPAQAA